MGPPVRREAFFTSAPKAVRSLKTQQRAFTTRSRRKRTLLSFQRPDRFGGGREKGLPTHRRPHNSLPSTSVSDGSVGNSWSSGRFPRRPFGQPRNDSKGQEGVKRTNLRFPA